MHPNGRLRRMEISRLEQILRTLAQNHNLYPASVPADAEQRSRLLAKTLAREGILLLAGDVPPAFMADRDQLLVHWVQIQVQLYKLLAEAFFPSYAGFKPPVYADRNLPALVVLEAESAAVTEELGKLIIPYIALRQAQTPVLDVELRGIMQLALQDLDPAKSRDHNVLTVRSMPLLKQWLANPIEQIPLIEPELPLYEELQRPQSPPPVPPAPPHSAPGNTAPSAVPPAPPPLPNSLPELEKLTSQPAKTDTQELFVSKVPIFWKRETQTRPPVPPPAKKKKGGE